MTSIQTTQNTITIQPLFKWDSEESQMTYLNLYVISVLLIYAFISIDEMVGA